MTKKSTIVQELLDMYRYNSYDDVRMIKPELNRVSDKLFSSSFICFKTDNRNSLLVATLSVLEDRAIVVVHNLTSKSRNIVPFYSTHDGRIRAIEELYLLLSSEKDQVIFGDEYNEVFENTLLWPFKITMKVPNEIEDDKEDVSLIIHHPYGELIFKMTYADVEKTMFAMMYGLV